MLRRLRTELRRARAFSLAGRTLARRAVSARRLSERLERAGVAPELGNEAVTVLSDAGLVDDARLARARADTLAKRGYGDAAILDRLAAEGIDDREAREAVGRLEREAVRATALVAAAGDRASAARRLVRRGFTHDTVEDVLGPLDSDA